jgi:hypothetical protein
LATEGSTVYLKSCQEQTLILVWHYLTAMHSHSVQLLHIKVYC